VVIVELTVRGTADGAGEGVGDGGGEGATTCQVADALAVAPSRVARTTTWWLPTPRPAYCWGLAQLKKLPLSRLHATLFALMVVNEIAAIVLVVGLAGLPVIVTLTEGVFPEPLFAELPPADAG
jgi:hypothetical protein